MQHQITLVPNNNPLYCSTECDRPAMLANGKICFKTCLKEARVPLSWLVKLAGIPYSTNMEPSSFSAAVHHWLLCECLNAIGSHSILWRSNPACLWFWKSIYLIIPLIVALIFTFLIFILVQDHTLLLFTILLGWYPFYFAWWLLSPPRIHGHLIYNVLQWIHFQSTTLGMIKVICKMYRRHFNRRTL